MGFGYCSLNAVFYGVNGDEIINSPVRLKCSAGGECGVFEFM